MRYLTPNNVELCCSFKFSSAFSLHYHGYIICPIRQRNIRRLIRKRENTVFRVLLVFFRSFKARLLLVRIELSRIECGPYANNNYLCCQNLTLARTTSFGVFFNQGEWGVYIWWPWSRLVYLCNLGFIVPWERGNRSLTPFRIKMGDPSCYWAKQIFFMFDV